MKKNRLNIILLFWMSLSGLVTIAQESDSLQVKRFFNDALIHSASYEHLHYLCKNIKGRQSGSPGLMAAIEYTRQVLKREGADTVYLQPVMIPNWQPGKETMVRISSRIMGHKDLSCVPLGNSAPTSVDGLAGEIIEIHDLSELERLGRAKVEGKIVFFNRPMDPTLISTGAAYGGAVDQRSAGPSKASEMGAKAAIVRSMTTYLDDFPHTGQTTFREGVRPIPAIAISTHAAEELSLWLKKEADLTCFIKSDCMPQPDAPGFNVIGEIRGSKYPDEIITVGGHLDAWFAGEGAQDDGAGCVQSMEVGRLYSSLHIRPLHTIRMVLFMDEENRQSGGKEYYNQAKLSNEKMILALESDRGGLSPRGFALDAKEPYLALMQSFARIFKPYGITDFVKGGSGTDVDPLKPLGTALVGFVPDGQRYFDYHHSPNDVFENVNFRELQLGSAAIASFIYLCDKYWPL